MDFLSCQTPSLRSKFPHSDLCTNPGYVLSPVITQRDAAGDASCSVKVSIEISESQQPVTFTCDGRDSNPRPSLSISKAEHRFGLYDLILTLSTSGKIKEEEKEAFRNEQIHFLLFQFLIFVKDVK